MLTAVLSTLALSVTATSWRAQIRTHRAEVHEAGEGYDPDVLRADYIATVELQGEPALSTCAGEFIIEQRANQKAIG